MVFCAELSLMISMRFFSHTPAISLLIMRFLHQHSFCEDRYENRMKRSLCFVCFSVHMVTEMNIRALWPLNCWFHLSFEVHPPLVILFPLLKVISICPSSERWLKKENTKKESLLFLTCKATSTESPPCSHQRKHI